jgi:signal transduction histidine kinase
MSGSDPAAELPETARFLEKELRWLLEHPYGFPAATLAFSFVIGAARQLGSPHAILEMAGTALVCAAWLGLWVRRGHLEPPGGDAQTIMLAIVGSLLLGRLVALEIAFAFAVLTLMPQFFLRLPFALAILCGFPAAIGSEYSHRLAVLADPSGFPWGLALMRAFALMMIGVTFKMLALQVQERARLQASLAAAERRAGVLEERQRLTREIHDTLAQGFAGIVVHLETAEQIDPLRHSAAKPHLDLARSVAREGLEEARRMLRALRPELLEQRALPEALDRVCDDWSRRSGLAANFSVTGTPAPMHPDIELTILRAVQEALTNIVRHAGARTAAVTLSYMEDILVLDVQDDGRGFIPAATGGSGFGLAGMRERTESLQGSFSLESVPGEGTTISISLPVLGTAGNDARLRSGPA